MEEIRNYKHSKFGITSFVLSMVSVFLIIIFIAVGVVVEINNPGMITSGNTFEVRLLGLGIILCAILLLISLIFGIIGVATKDSKKIFSVLGLIISGCFVTLILISIS